MQQPLDFILFLVSYAIIIFWGIMIFRYKGIKTFGLRLSKKQITVFAIIELLLFVLMYLNYEANKSPEIADSFAWHNSIIYARGVLPIAGLASLNDKVFNMKDPILLCLVMGLIVDYILFFLLTKVADLIKKN